MVMKVHFVLIRPKMLELLLDCIAELQQRRPEIAVDILTPWASFVGGFVRVFWWGGLWSPVFWWGEQYHLPSLYHAGFDIFLSHGADPNAYIDTERYRMTPFCLVLMSVFFAATGTGYRLSDYHLKVFDSFLSAGADVHAPIEVREDGPFISETISQWADHYLWPEKGIYTGLEAFCKLLRALRHNSKLDRTDKGLILNLASPAINSILQKVPLSDQSLEELEGTIQDAFSQTMARPLLEELQSHRAKLLK
ncbi:Fc.00g109380.m01.CDS01 [Cosmosporella sp. VM-42]